MDRTDLFIGTAGWNIPKEFAPRFPGEGTHLARYAGQLTAVEINSSFYRPHKPETYARWAESTPEGFRFAVKVPKEVTHVRRLTDAALLDRFADETAALGGKLGAWLVQLPPGLGFHPPIVERFFDRLRLRFDGHVACEPRHPSWFTPEAERMLDGFRVGRVAADPAVRPEGTQPGGWPGLVYYRLHGSPRMYYSAYAIEFLRALAGMVTAATRLAPTWCIFNNTAQGAAVENALAFQDLLLKQESTH